MNLPTEFTWKRKEQTIWGAAMAGTTDAHPNSTAKSTTGLIRFVETSTSQTAAYKLENVLRAHNHAQLGAASQKWGGPPAPVGLLRPELEHSRATRREACQDVE